MSALSSIATQRGLRDMSLSPQINMRADVAESIEEVAKLMGGWRRKGLYDQSYTPLDRDSQKFNRLSKSSFDRS